MKLIEWSKKNYLIIILFLVTVLVLSIKIKTRIQDSNTDKNLPKITPIVENKINNLVSPTPIINNLKLFGGKTKEEILQMEPEEGYDFITKLSREEVEELDMMPNYDFSGFLPYLNDNFIVEKFDYQNKKLTVKPLIEDKNKIKEEVNGWLFYENGNNPSKIEIIWSE